MSSHNQPVQHSKLSISLFRLTEKLVGLKASNGIKNRHFWIILAMAAIYIVCIYIIIPVFYDLYVIFLFPPLLYAALTYRFKGALLGSLIFVAILVPKTLPLSTEIPEMVRSFVFLVFPFLLSGFVAAWLHYFDRQTEAYQEILALNNQLQLSMDNLEKTRKQLVQSEKLHALGQLSAAIAHEINNPLAGTIVYAQYLHKKLAAGELNNQEAADIAARMETALTQSAQLVRSLLDFARQSTPSFKSIAMPLVLDQVIALVKHQAEMRKIHIIRKEGPDIIPVKGDFTQLQQVFINLVVNSIQAMNEGGRLTISVTREGDLIKTDVCDTGCGIPPENMDKLFTPFFSTKEDVKGVGLGLAVSYGIIERHSGRIEVQSEAGQGSTFSVYLPGFPDDDSILQ